MNKTILSLLILLTSIHLSCCGREKADTLNMNNLEQEQQIMLAGLKKKYPFLQLQHNSITGDQALLPFFEKMHSLAQNNDRVINIVHIGDSHIQADIMTEELRFLLQKAFGSAGRGLIFPHRIARSNEPDNIQSTSSGEWSQVSIISKNRESEPGLATRTIFTTDRTASFSILLKDSSNFNNKIRVFAPKSEAHFDFSISNYFDKSFSSGHSADSTFVFDTLGHCFTLKITPTADTQKEFRLNGIVLQNKEASGILFHSMGTNGAHFSEYNNAAEFFRQLPELQPDLIIISLGTNEGAARDITEEKVYADAQKMIENIRAGNPQTPILLTTPVHNFYQKKYPNQRITLVRKALLKVAIDSKTAVLDLYTAGGGYGSCQKWKANGLLRPDGVHFSKEGYQLQGDMIYNAIINSYLKYAN